MTSGIARKVVQYFSRGGPAPEVEPLAGRERQVLIALSQGQQYKEIADTLGITVDAVHKDIRAVYDKLHGSAAITAGRSPRASL